MSSPALCPAQFLLRLRLGMKSHIPGSFVARRSTASARARLITSSGAAKSCGPRRVAFQQGFNSPPTCFAVSVLSSWSSSQVPASKTPFTENSLIEVCSAKVRPRYFVLHRDEAPSQIASTFRLECRTRCHCRLETTGLSEYSIRIQSFRLKNSPDVRRTCLDRVQHSNECSRTESRVPLSSSCWFGKHVQNILPKFQNRSVVPSSMQCVYRRLSVTADVAPVHQMRSELNQPAQYPCSRRDFHANTMLQCSFQ